jgi:hypothetical protein
LADCSDLFYLLDNTRRLPCFPIMVAYVTPSSVSPSPLGCLSIGKRLFAVYKDCRYTPYRMTSGGTNGSYAVWITSHQWVDARRGSRHHLHQLLTRSTPTPPPSPHSSSPCIHASWDCLAKLVIRGGGSSTHLITNTTKMLTYTIFLSSLRYGVDPVILARRSCAPAFFLFSR